MIIKYIRSFILYTVLVCMYGSQAFAGNSFVDNFTFGDTIDTSVWNEIESTGSNIVIGGGNVLVIYGKNNTYHNNVLETDATFAREDNFSVEVVMRASVNNTVVGGFGWGDRTWALTPSTSSGYYIQFQQDGNFRIVSKVAPNPHTTVLTTVPYVANRWYKVIMTVGADDVSFKVYEDANDDRDFLDAGEDVDILIPGLNSISGSFDNKPIILYGVANSTNVQFDYINVTANQFDGPTSLDAEGFYRKALVDWNEPADSSAVTDYQIEYSVANANSWTIFNDGVSTNTYGLVTGLQDSTAYDFRVAAIRDSTVSEYTTPVVSTTTLSTDTPSIIYHIPQIGQSLSTGSMGSPALTTTQPYNNLTVDGEILKDLIEGAGYSGFGLDDKGNVETNSSSMANTLTNLGGDQFVTLVTRHGKGGAEYNAIKKGTVYYQNLIDTVSIAKNAAMLLGKTYIVPAVTIIHGESDQNLGASSATYQGYMEELQEDLDTDIKAITGQSQEVMLVTDQMSSLLTATINLGQLSAAEANPDKIALVGPKYIFDYVDNYHMNNNSYRMLGEYYGKAFKKILVDNQPWVPFSPKNIVRNGSNIYISFNIPEPPIVIDTTWVSLKTNYGFSFSQTGGNSPSISSVSIVPDYNDIKIALNTTPTGTSQKVRYAYTGAFDTPGRLESSSQKGNIRDSDDTDSLYGNDLYNWLVHFSKDITNDTTSPIIESIANTSISSTSQRVDVSSNEEVTFTIDYGPRPLLAGQYSTSTITNRVSDNTVTLTSLIPCTRYYYRLTISDLARNTTTSSVDNFVTNGCVGSASIEDQQDAFIPISTGGVHSLINGLSNISLTIPSGFAGADSVFQIKRLNKSSVSGAIGSPTKKTAVSQHIYALKSLPSATSSFTSFDEPISVKIGYNDIDVTNVSEAELRIYRYDGSAWAPLSNCSVDSLLNTVTCPTSNFSVFGLFKDDDSEDPVESRSTTIGWRNPKIESNDINNNSVMVSKEICFEISSKNVLKFGSHGTDVVALQKFLLEKNYSVGVIDGIFGKKTKIAVLDFQAKNQLDIDGVVGRKTLNKMQYACVESNKSIHGTIETLPDIEKSCDFKKAKKGDSGKEVGFIQEFLAGQNYYKGTSDGFFGPATELATKQFQMAYKKEILELNGLKNATGLFYENTIKKAREICETH